ncbi:MAG TPA: outer membrane beta-barrel protein [Gelidibacter sp.]|uniref:outer membrane beta-barrel protein n=1 Tax=Gelidibacter sp. TaxID=2018083 RepID=UPI002C23E257|nr:outer membrane beta-barrel protein [Gelidibacter sp.]HXK00206.1 outer membrane beta-barrel protein [Gelidibacter sp.]
MKKLLLVAVVAVFGFFNVNAQSKFGVMAGYTNIQQKFTMKNTSASSGDSGFFIGGVADFTISEQFHIQPEVLYANASEVNFLYIPVLAKYMVSEEFGILVGPQANFVLEEAVEGLSNFGLELTFGGNYKITDNFFLEARYGFELTNRLSDMSGADGAKYRINTLHIGVGYMF